MPPREEGYNISETGNWNVADDYSKLKIMRPLYLIDEYRNIAIFGSASLIEQLQNQMPVDYLRIKGFERLVHTMIQLIDNTLFACKQQDVDLMAIRIKLNKIIEMIPTFTKIISRDRGKSQEMKIIEDRYQSVLQEVLVLIDKINRPLNKNHLIFTDKEEFDPVAYKQMIKERIVNRG